MSCFVAVHAVSGRGSKLADDVLCSMGHFVDNCHCTMSLLAWSFISNVSSVSDVYSKHVFSNLDTERSEIGRFVVSIVNVLYLFPVRFSIWF